MELDVTIAELAERQHGVVSRRQLIKAGASRDAVQRRVAMRRLHPVHAGVYAVGHCLLRPQGRYLAAVMACGEGAVLSHRAAAALLDLRPSPSGRIDVTIRRRGTRHRNGIAVHSTRWLPPGEVMEHDHIRCTSPSRTLVDLAAVVTPRMLDRALEQSLILRLFDGTALDAVLRHAQGRRGTTELRRLLEKLAEEPPLLRNELERRFLELVRRARLPIPVVNGLVAGHQVDFHWPAQRLVAETDGRATHDTAYGFERDRRRDLDLELAGWHVVRITWRQLREEPARVTAMLRARLDWRR